MISLSVGSNPVSVAVTAQDGATVNTYTIAVTRAASSNADLSNLAISSGTLSPAFSSATQAYSATVVSDNNAITATPTVADATATVTVNNVAVASGTASGAITLSLGSNVLTVVVTAQDGVTTRTYTVDVTYLPPSSCTYSLSPLDLSNLAAAGGPATIVVTTPDGCPVPVVSYQPWVTVTSITPDAGTTTVVLQIAANPGPERATSIQVADRLFLVTQLSP
jgi:hypothetical protein